MENRNSPTVFIKGITIILMFCNHLFPIPEWIFESNRVLSFAIGSKTIASYIGGFGKICVAVFAYLTGIGLYFVFQRKTYEETVISRIKYSVKKCVDILITYEGILLLFYIPLATFFGVNDYTGKELLDNIFLIDTSIIRVAWYVRFYIELMITIPILYALLKSRESQKDIVTFIVIVLLHYFMYVMKFKYFEEYFNYLMVVITGYLFEKYNVNNKLKSAFSKRLKVNIGVLGIMVILRGLLKSVHFINTDIFFVPIYVAIMSDFYYRTGKNLKKVVLLLGQYSMELWFLHAIFFIGSEKLQKIGYWPKIDILILIWTLLLLFPLAVLYKKLFDCLKQFAKKTIIYNCTVTK